MKNLFLKLLTATSLITTTANAAGYIQYRSDHGHRNIEITGKCKDFTSLKFQDTVHLVAQTKLAIVAPTCVDDNDAQRCFCDCPKGHDPLILGESEKTPLVACLQIRK